MQTQPKRRQQKPPTTIKELKSFLGKVYYIRRLIPSLASSTSAFTKLLKKGQSFEWGNAQQKAFQKLQQIMIKLPIVQASVRRKPLLFYLASSSSTIGALIAQEDEGGIKQLVYYISHALSYTETRYPQAKKVCLAIIYTSQRLCHYFLSYEVNLMTKSHTIKVLLRQPILFGRICQDIYESCQEHMSSRIG